MMAMIDLLLNRVRGFRKSAGISKSALARRAGLSRAALQFMDADHWSPTADTLRCVEKAIDQYHAETYLRSLGPKKEAA